jgi:antitoxin (DNA-binding transcriptional repressor) of toxin-antitoxin stability system
VLESACSTVRYGVGVAEQINQRTLRNDSGRVMRALDDGQSFVVTRDGRPVGELVPLRRHRLVPAAAVVEVFRNAPRVDRHRFRDELDAVVDQDVEPRG